MPKADGYIGVVQLLIYLPRQRLVLQVKMGQNSVLKKLTRGSCRGSTPWRSSSSSHSPWEVPRPFLCWW